MSFVRYVAPRVLMGVAPLITGCSAAPAPAPAPTPTRNEVEAPTVAPIRRVDEAAVEAVVQALATTPDSVAAVRKLVEVSAGGAAGAPDAKAITSSIRDKQVDLVKQTAVLMTEIQVGARASNAVLTAFNFGLTVGWTANPFASPTLTGWYDRVARFLDFAPPVVYGISLRATDNRGAQLNALALSFLGAQAIKTVANRDNARASKTEAALGTAKGVYDYLEFNRMVFTDSKRLANAAATARSTDSSLARDITAFMRKYNNFPLLLNEGVKPVHEYAEFATYISEAVPLIERFQQQLARTHDFYVLASSAVDTYSQHPIGKVVAGDSVSAVPPAAERLKDDARRVLASLRQAHGEARDDWDDLRDLLVITPSRVATLMQFATLDQLVPKAP